jgi:hypothetical protein
VSSNLPCIIAFTLFIPGNSATKPDAACGSRASVEVTGTYLPVSLRKITSINYPTWSWALRDTQSFSPFPPLSSGNGSQVKGETTRFISSLSVWPSSYPFIPFLRPWQWRRMALRWNGDRTGRSQCPRSLPEEP